MQLKEIIKYKITVACAVLTFSIFIGTNSFAQNPVKDIGNVKTVKINGQQVSITTENANALITVYSPDIIRVRIDKQNFKPDQSYAVIMQPVTTAVKITEDKNQVNIVTDSLKVKILKSPFFQQTQTH